MTQRYDAGHAQAHAQDILNRWYVLAERRLDHLIELYESGRWRRYHSENAFMENLREAKTVVEIWRVLARREATPDNRAIDWSWLDQFDQPAEVSSAIQDEQSSARLLGTAAVHAALASIVVLQDDAAVEADDAPAGEETTSSAELTTGILPDLRTLQERYPMLQHNTL